MAETVLPRAVAAEVRAEIARQGVTQRSVADASDIHRVSLGRKLRGQTDFYLDEFLRVCEAIHTSPSELIRRAEDVVEATA